MDLGGAAVSPDCFGTEDGDVEGLRGESGGEGRGEERERIMRSVATMITRWTRVYIVLVLA